MHVLRNRLLRNIRFELRNDSTLLTFSNTITCYSFQSMRKRRLECHHFWLLVRHQQRVPLILQDIDCCLDFDKCFSTVPHFWQSQCTYRTPVRVWSRGSPRLCAWNPLLIQIRRYPVDFEGFSTNQNVQPIRVRALKTRLRVPEAKSTLRVNLKSWNATAGDMQIICISW